MGLGCFCKYQISNGDQELDSYYIRYFSFKEAYHIRQVSRQNKHKKKSHVKEDHEQSLLTLLDSALAIHQLSSALIWLDNNSDLYRLFSTLPKGLMNFFYDEKEVQIIAKPISLNY